jgi:hypothetical protein
VTVRPPLWLAAALGLCMAHPLAASAADPPRRLEFPAASANQKIADAVADAVRQSGQIRGYSVDISVQGGVAEVSGTVADPPQHDEVLRLARGVPGVERVVDRLIVPQGVQRVRDEAPPETEAPPLAPEPRPLPPPGAPTGPAAGTPPEPTPIFQPPAPSPYDLNPPKMPPYAWPSYAPYNNYSRVATPLAYPYNSWPFIGPIYPFPKVPLGWRSVKLEWDDGYWWFSRTATKYDWWRLRYW